MRVISRKKIEDFVRHHPTAKASLDHWYHVVQQATWRSLAEVRQVYPHADVVGRRTVFNIAGNQFRLIARINYQKQVVFVGYVLTHADYDKGDWKK
jgi:mRNA interferase HigB